ncbi:MAG: thiamine-phosphate kinase [Phycisphaerae bacterium]|nr:thiamine-phosphate kinase [Phycisphaerae bacterium]
MRESDLLAHIYARSADLGSLYPRVLVGPGDDCAVLDAGGGPPLLLKVDQVVAGRHFEPFPRTPMDLIGRKSIARAVSDVAAMGGTPMVALAAAAIPDALFGRADHLFDAMHRWARHWGCPLIGGDISSTPGPLTIAVTIVGTPHHARGPVLRSGARPGDLVCVTGRLGGAVDAATSGGRHLTFEPRLAEARALCDTLGGRLHALMDLSDGLGIDASRMADASRCRITIDAAAIPRAPGVSGWREAAGAGEDYELLFTLDPDCTPPPACPGTSTTITVIGRVLEPAPGPACAILDAGTEHDGSSLGWDHARPGPTP